MGACASDPLVPMAPPGHSHIHVNVAQVFCTCGSISGRTFVRDEDLVYDATPLLRERLPRDLWTAACHAMTRAWKDNDMNCVLSSMAFVVIPCGGLCCVMSKQRRQFVAVFSEVCKLDKYLMRPRGLRMQLME